MLLTAVGEEIEDLDDLHQCSHSIENIIDDSHSFNVVEQLEGEPEVPIADLRDCEEGCDDLQKCKDAEND